MKGCNMCVWACSKSGETNEIYYFIKKKARERVTAYDTGRWRHYQIEEPIQFKWFFSEKKKQQQQHKRMTWNKSRMTLKKSWWYLIPEEELMCMLIPVSSGEYRFKYTPAWLIASFSKEKVTEGKYFRKERRTTEKKSPYKLFLIVFLG